MDPKTFVDQLARLAPSEADLKRIGLTKSQAIAFRNSFLCRERQSDIAETNDVLALLQGWDLSSVQIGMVRFAKEPKKMSGKVCIGKVEADPLVIISSTGEIHVEEFHVPGHSLWLTARNGSMFLDALIPAAEFLSKRIIGEIEYEDTNVAWEVADRCALFAGGEQFFQFYSTLLGVE